MLEESRFSSDYTEKIASWDPYDTNRSVDWFDPEWMFGIENKKDTNNQLNKTSVFDIVIGNPPYVSTKGVPENEKKRLMQQYGFADDLYSHFFFRGFDFLKSNGVLSFITSKTYWTIQTKRNVRELLQKNNILEIFDTAFPFAAMVDTAVILVQKREETNNYTFFFKDGKQNFNDPQVYSAKIDWYRNVANNVFFIPTERNKKIQQKYGKQVKQLLDTWWDKISTSKNIQKYHNELERYRKSLNIGDVTLLGLITEGGQGLATANNKYWGMEGTRVEIKTTTPKIIFTDKFCNEHEIKIKRRPMNFCRLTEKKSENCLRRKENTSTFRTRMVVLNCQPKRNS